MWAPSGLPGDWWDTWLLGVERAGLAGEVLGVAIWHDLLRPRKSPDRPGLSSGASQGPQTLQ